MSYTLYAENMLIALYQESEFGGNEKTFGSVAGKYGLSENQKWAERLSEEWKANGLVQVDAFLGSPLGWYLDITGAGMRYIENKYGDKDGVGIILEPVGDHLSPDVEQERAVAVDSAAWTGRLVVSDQSKVEITSIVHRMRSYIETSHLSNVERANALAAVEAVEALVEAPDPLWEVVLSILSSPVLANVAALAALVISIVKP